MRIKDVHVGHLLNSFGELNEDRIRHKQPCDDFIKAVRESAIKDIKTLRVISDPLNEPESVILYIKFKFNIHEKDLK